MHISRAFLYICLFLITGIAISSFFIFGQFYIFALIAVGVALIAVFWRKNLVTKNFNGTRFLRSRIVVFGFCLLALAGGLYRAGNIEKPKDGKDYYSNYYKTNLEGGGRIVEGLSKLRFNLQASLDSRISPPEGAILSAILLGDKEDFSYDLKQELSRSGTRHITAISGMHIMIVSAMLVGLGLLFGMWRKQAFIFAIAAVVLYIIMIGAPPSAVRAGIMGSIIFIAQAFGRIHQGERLLLIAAAFMLLFNPLLLKYDLGFQLSFLATYGIAKLSPWFREKLKFLPNTINLRNNLAMTFPAIIFTAPVVAYNFGEVSLISPLSNILLVPLLPLIFGFGFFAMFLGNIFSAISAAAFWPVWLVSAYMYKIINIFANTPFAFLNIENLSIYFVAIYFAILLWGIKRFKLDLI